MTAPEIRRPAGVNVGLVALCLLLNGVLAIVSFIGVKKTLGSIIFLILGIVAVILGVYGLIHYFKKIAEVGIERQYVERAYFISMLLTGGIIVASNVLWIISLALTYYILSALRRLR